MLLVLSNLNSGVLHLVREPESGEAAVRRQRSSRAVGGYLMILLRDR